MILDRWTIFRRMFPARRGAGGPVARWAAAAEREPELAADVIRLGGVLAMAPARFEDGVEAPDPIDPIRMAKAEGRRELALELLAMMTVGPREFRDLMENDDA